MIPLACMADFARESGQLGADVHDRAEQHHLLQRVYAPVSPLGRRPRVTGRRALVLAARGDRVTPVTHAERLAEHLDAPLQVFTGGHVLQAGRGQAFRAMRTLLAREGILAGHGEG